MESAQHRGAWLYNEVEAQAASQPDGMEVRSEKLSGGPWRLRLLGVSWISSVVVAGFLGRLSAVPQHLARDPSRSHTSDLRLASGPKAKFMSAAETPNTFSYYALYEETFAKAQYIDLTHAFSPTIPVWPGFGASFFKAGVSGHTDEFSTEGDEWKYGVHGFQTTMYVLTTDQLGTQLDPPAHWNEFGATISDLPATIALRPLVVVDIHDKVAENSSYHAAVEDVKAWENKNGQVPEGSVVMFRSDFYKGFEEYAKSGLPDEFPGVTLDALKFLHNNRSILFHGHEALDVDMTPNLEGEAWLMHSNFAQAEGVARLDEVPEAGCLLSIGFAKPLGGTGGYARYIAICPEGTPQGVSISEAPGAPLRTQEDPLRRDSDGVLRPTKGAEPTEYCAADTPALGCEGAGQPVWGE